MIKSLIKFLTISLLAISCSNFNSNSKNDATQEELHSYYKGKGKLEVEAMKYMLKHINDKKSCYNHQTDSFLTDLSNKIDTYDKPYKIYNELFNVEFSKQDYSETNDLENINSLDIISHINTTFSNWQNLSSVSGASFSDYKEYILPHRTMNEAIDLNNTALFYNENKYLVDTLLNGANFEQCISDFIASQKFSIWNVLSNKYSHNFSAYQTYRIKQIPRCDDAVICLICILRALGIPCTMDLIPQWGSHHSIGHGWLAAKWQNEWYAFDAIDGRILKPIYRKSSMPKIYRLNYYNEEHIDVTSEYKQTYRITIPSRKITEKGIPAVALFQQGGHFKIIATGKWCFGKMVFKNIGDNVLYFPGIATRKGFIPQGTPFYIDKTGNTHFLKRENNDTYNIIELERKYPLWTARSSEKIDYIRSLEGAYILAKNTHLNIADTLFTIKNCIDPLTKFFTINSENKYDFILFKTNKEVWLSELHFFDEKMNEIKGKLINYGIRESTVMKIFDNDNLTYSGSPYPITIGYRLNEPHIISQITIHPRNDGNHIEIGDEYELMIWDDGWKSFGRQIAKTNKLEYSSVPENCVYWLRNLTKGIEELPFMLTDDGKQFWPGQ